MQAPMAISWGEWQWLGSTRAGMIQGGVQEGTKGYNWSLGRHRATQGALTSSGRKGEGGGQREGELRAACMRWICADDCGVLWCALVCAKATPVIPAR